MKIQILVLFVSSLVFSLVPTEKAPDASVLIGTWKLDLSPHITDDNNFAMMQIESINKDAFKGTFYRKGVKIQEGQLNTQTDVIYGALVSGDNSGNYNTSFYFKDGKLYGSTHAIQRDFLAVWVGTKIK